MNFLYLSGDVAPAKVRKICPDSISSGLVTLGFIVVTFSGLVNSSG